MRTLQPTYGTEPHKRAIQAHVQRCRQQQHISLFNALKEEGAVAYQALKLASRAVEDTLERSGDCTADIDGAEIGFENEARKTLSAVTQINIDQPQLGIQAEIFPEGLGGVIDPERRKQIIPGHQLLERMKPFLTISEVQVAHDKLQISLARLEETLKNKEQAEKDFKVAFTHEQRCRKEVREQLRSAKGRLEEFFKKTPGLVEGYFISDPRTGSSALSQAEARGRIAGKFEVLLSYLERKEITLPDQEQERLLADADEDAVDLWLTRAFGGASLEEIFAPPPEEEKKKE